MEWKWSWMVCCPFTHWFHQWFQVVGYVFLAHQTHLHFLFHSPFQTTLCGSLSSLGQRKEKAKQMEWSNCWNDCGMEFGCAEGWSPAITHYFIKKRAAPTNKSNPFRSSTAAASLNLIYWRACRAAGLLGLPLSSLIHCGRFIDFINKLIPSINQPFHSWVSLHSHFFSCGAVDCWNCWAVCWCLLLWAEPLAGQPAYNPPTKPSTSSTSSNSTIQLHSIKELKFFWLVALRYFYKKDWVCLFLRRKKRRQNFSFLISSIQLWLKWRNWKSIITVKWDKLMLVYNR